MKRFTLIELLIVVAIIGILASLLLPSLSTARQKGYTASCLSNMRQTAIGNQLFASDSNNGIVQTYHKSPGFYYGWDLSLQDYMGDEFSSKREAGKGPSPGDAAICPAYDDLTVNYVKPGVVVDQAPKESAENGMRPSRHPGKYISTGINEFLSNGAMLPAGYPGNGPNSDGSWLSTYGKRWVQMSEIEKPGDTMIFCEIYDSAKLTKWQKAYFNPNHGYAAPYARVDASAKTMKYKSVVNDGVSLNSTGNNARNKLSEEEIDLWGIYVSPRF